VVQNDSEELVKFVLESEISDNFHHYFEASKEYTNYFTNHNKNEVRMPLCRSLKNTRTPSTFHITTRNCSSNSVPRCTRRSPPSPKESSNSGDIY
jgi:hypothetical protein